jgi:hypothetical protein
MQRIEEYLPVVTYCTPEAKKNTLGTGTGSLPKVAIFGRDFSYVQRIVFY